MEQPTTTKIHPLLLRVAKRFWPELEQRAGERLVVGVGEVISTLYSMPFALTGAIWLVSLTDLNWLQTHFKLFVLFAVLVWSFNQLRFFLIIELRKNRYGSSDGSLTGIPLWSGVLIFGPTIFWLQVIYVFFQYFLNIRRTNSKAARWGLYRNLAMNLTTETLVPLLAFTIYKNIGGVFPFSELSEFSYIW